jgi:cold shock protein
MAKGTVKWFNSEKGFGFITPEGDERVVFVHHKDIIVPGYRTLEENQQVEFSIAQGPKGYTAMGVRPL